MARSLLNERNLPSNLLGEAVRHAFYIMNKLPTRGLSKMTPHEAWTGVKPSFDFVNVFGCVAHIKIPGVHLKKLDNRSKVGVYLGKEPGTKAFRLYDPSTRGIQVSRDIVFEEEKCWE